MATKTDLTAQLTQTEDVRLCVCVCTHVCRCVWVWVHTLPNQFHLWSHLWFVCIEHLSQLLGDQTYLHLHKRCLVCHAICQLVIHLSLKSCWFSEWVLCSDCWTDFVPPLLPSHSLPSIFSPSLPPPSLPPPSLPSSLSVPPSPILPPSSFSTLPYFFFPPSYALSPVVFKQTKPRAWASEIWVVVPHNHALQWAFSPGDGWTGESLAGTGWNPAEVWTRQERCGEIIRPQGQSVSLSFCQNLDVLCLNEASSCILKQMSMFRKNVCTSWSNR